MARRQRRAAGWIAAVILAGNAGVLAAQSGKPDLRSLASDLQLDARGARTWLVTLGVEADPGPSEHLLAVTPDGRIVARRDGGAQHVLLGLELDTRLVTAGSD